MTNNVPPCPLCNTDSRLNFTKYDRDFFACTTCGLEFIYPQPSPDEIAALYDQSYYDSWGLDNSDDVTERMKQSTFHDKLVAIEKIIPDKGRILDIGCATGYFLDAARQRGWDTYGVELSDYSSEIAKQKIGSDRVFSGRVEESAFDASSFDAIMMTDVIEHVCDVHTFLNEIVRILKPAGLICITTPNPAGLWCRLLGRNWPHYKLEHLVYYTPKALERLLAQKGFSRLHLSAATKTLTLAYLNLQLRTYPLPLVTPLISLLTRIIPESATHSRFKIHSGELFLISRLGVEIHL